MSDAGALACPHPRPPPTRDTLRPDRRRVCKCNGPRAPSRLRAHARECPHRPQGLTAHAEHHADRGLPDGVPGHALVAACVRSPNVVDGQEPLGANVKFPTFRHLNPILEQSRTEMILGLRPRSRSGFTWGGGTAARTSPMDMARGYAQRNPKLERKGDLVQFTERNFS